MKGVGLQCRSGREWGQFSNIFGQFLSPGFIFAIMFCTTPERVPKVKIPHPILESLLDRFGVLGESIFFYFFSVPLLDGILVSFGAKVAPKRELLGIILDTIW